eukprot:NODE_6741_length_623_cov_31.889113_g6718_i0.p1 GENE.NODE_6741_length_623_cov_31.889113_g6718_i0~~NODE_6741_length_623_cov_31.889113_g6718_i0.p1  ORF type:complete len:174 (+),score=23.46 NODE_6741_length_623_cov_31.889113_g6718_i0:38-523(+)
MGPYPPSQIVDDKPDEYTRAVGTNIFFILLAAIALFCIFVALGMAILVACRPQVQAWHESRHRKKQDKVRQQGIRLPPPRLTSPVSPLSPATSGWGSPGMSPGGSPTASISPTLPTNTRRPAQPTVAPSFLQADSQIMYTLPNYQSPLQPPSTRASQYLVR